MTRRKNPWPVALVAAGFCLAALGCAVGALPVDPLEPRFVRNECGAVVDHATGLEWLAGPDRMTFIADARRFVHRLGACGHDDWRLPSFHELRSIYLPGRGPKNLDPLLTTDGDMLWAGDVTIFGYTYLRLVDGMIGWDTLGRRKHGYRVLAVRGERLRDVWGN